ncbi:hypothetical protein HMPREF9336_01543 [Segniliparus rugosus ATCC BAA-974]|uniref:Uncharacterized protein n=2 Tax=Segniliparus rugosus TaxID=286804 RepID=E5XPX1_SEGRC|nr:hypothetical protein HMPREF9336_01543 [Segniliparus rugosus ATCC BAA-974]
MPKLLGERVEGFDSNKRARALVRPLDGRPEGFELQAGAWVEFQRLFSSGHATGAQALRATTVEAFHAAGKSGKARQHALTYRPPKQKSVEQAYDEAVQSGEIDEEDTPFWKFAEQWRKPKAKSEQERYEADTAAGAGEGALLKVEKDPEKVLATPVGEDVGPLTERAMKWRAEVLKRLSEVSASGSVGTDDDARPRVKIAWAPSGIAAVELVGDVLGELTSQDYQRRVLLAAQNAWQKMADRFKVEVPEEFGWPVD